MTDHNRARNAWDEVTSIHGRSPSDSIELGPSASYQYRVDPKHLCFVLSRYKFCSKSLAGKARVLEVGCGDAFGTPIVAQAVTAMVGIDWDSALIEGNKRRLSFLSNCTFKYHDIVAEPLSIADSEKFDAVFSLDVIEHVEPQMEQTFMRNCCDVLKPGGVCIVGTPNVTADAYASSSSKAGHINLKDADGLMQLMANYFEAVFLFSMNDEVVHTGFYPMAHYLLALGVGKKKG